MSELRNIIASVFVLLLLGSPVFAQYDFIDTLDIKPNKLRGLAREAERTGNAYTALYYYELLVKERPTLDNQFRLAYLYMYTRDYSSAVREFQEVVKKDAKTSYPRAHFYLGLMQKHTGKYEEAIESFLNFKSAYRTASLDDRELRKRYKLEIEGCEYALETQDSIANYVVGNLGSDVNYPHIEFSPIPITDDHIIYGSMRKEEEKFYDALHLDTIELPVRKFYEAEKSGNTWSFKGEWDHPANRFQSDVGNGAFNLDSTRFYFTICEQNWQFKIICKIHYSERNENGSWSEPVLMDENINMPNHSSSHPTVGRSSRYETEVLYFASDRPRSKGGFDIWYAEFHPRKEEFKKAKNAGRSINTAGDEVTPFYDAKNKTLYFASNGLPNIGGYDIFKIEGETKRWEDEPSNMGKPVNSSADDLDFAIKPSGKGGFFVSNRKGGQSLFNPTCCDDVYEFTDADFIELLVEGDLIDKETGECIEHDGRIKVYLIDNEGERYLSQTVKVDDCRYKTSLQPGKEYRFETDVDGYFSAKVSLSTKEIVQSEVLEKDIELEKMPAQPMVLKNVNYEFDSPRLTQDAINTLDTTLLVIMNDNPEIVVEISSHTDSKGSDSYNMRLSQKRAESVVNYLKKNGIPEERMVPKGYGESQPIAPNTHEDGSDNPEGRAKNRRTEFKIIGKIDPSTYIIYDDDDDDDE